MKKLLVYYIMIALPLGLLVLGGRFGWFSAIPFGILLFTYALIYHPYVSGIRLIEGGIIKRSQLWKTFIPGWNSRYFSYLFFNKRPII